MSADTQPALPPPPGVTPNFVDPPSLDKLVVGTFSVCLAVTTVSTIIRFHAQLRLFGKLTWADLFVSIAWACHIVFDAILLSALPHGLGRHQWHVSQAQHTVVEYLLYISFILYDPAILFAKLSILNQFIHIFSPSYRNRIWYAAVALSVINVLFYIPLTFALIFSCTPRQKIWDPSLPGKCLNQTALLTSSGPFNVISDLLIFLLPIWGIWQLRISLKKRFSISTGFAVGLFGCICSAVRIAYSARLARTGDGTYVIAQNQMWANAECTVGILIANFIILPRYIRSFRRGSSSSSSSAKSDSTQTNSHDLKDYLRRKKRGKQAADSSGEEGFEWDREGPVPQGEAFNTMTQNSRHTNTMHSRLSEEMDLRPQDRARIAPWASLEDEMGTARLWVQMENNKTANGTVSNMQTGAKEETTDGGEQITSTALGR